MFSLFIPAVLVGAQVVPTADFVARTVPETSVFTQAERLLPADGAVLYKAGLGEWAFPDGLLAFGRTFDFHVDEGTVSAVPGQDVPGVPALPDSVRDRLFLWVDARDADASHLVLDETGALDVWYDVRESAADADGFVPTQAYATTHVDVEHGASFAPRKAPELKAFGTAAAVYFGQLRSGSWMPWVRPGGAYEYRTDSIRHVFAVHAVSESYGCVFGFCNSNGTAPSLTQGDGMQAGASLNSPMGWNSQWSDMMNARLFVNGRRVDGNREPPVRGLQLMECAFGLRSGTANCFFRDRGTAGGDYLCEALVFTGDLTEEERTLVGDYLVRKWNIASGAARAELADGASWQVAAGESGVTIDAVAFSGDGRVVKRGSGDLVYGTRAGTDGPAVLDLREGRAVLRSALRVAVQSGDRLVTEARDEGLGLLRIADAPAGTVVKEGPGEVALAAVPADLRCLDVRAGSVFLQEREPRSVEPFVGAEVAIANPSFEEGDDDGFATGGVNVLASGTHGWTKLGGGNVWIFDFENWPVSPGTCPAISNTPRNAWPIATHPPAGRRALMMQLQGAAVGTAVEMPLEGWYELSVRHCGREGDGSYGQECDVSLRDASGATVAYFGRLRDLHHGGYTHTVLSAKAPAGRYTLRFENVRGNPEYTGEVGLTVLDDLSLRRVPAPEREMWPVPGGSFEQAVLKERGDYRANILANTMPGWTFTQPEGAPTGPSDTPSVGLVTRAMQGRYALGGLHNDSRGCRGGFVEVLFRSDRAAGPSSAATTFTPPAGTHYLQASLAFFGPRGGKLAATLAFESGDTVELGVLQPANKLMAPQQWPRPFTSDGVTPVTLTLTFTPDGAETGVFLDDVGLVARGPAAASVEVLRNGGFEAQTDWMGYARPDAGSGNAALRRPYTEAPAILGTDIVDGKYYQSLQGGVGVRQEVDIPEAGTYEFAFFSHHRHSSQAGGYPGNPVRAGLISAAGVTNLLGRWETTTFSNMEHRVRFPVSEAGRYTFFLEGLDFARPGYGPEAHVDRLSMRSVVDPQPSVPAPFAADAVIRVAQGAHLHLGFSGTNKVGRVVLGGDVVVGDLSAQTHPDYLAGPGVLRTIPHGTCLFIR